MQGTRTMTESILGAREGQGRREKLWRGPNKLCGVIDVFIILIVIDTYNKIYQIIVYFNKYSLLYANNTWIKLV